MRPVEKFAYTFATTLAVVERQFVHVHPDEFVGQRRVQPAAERQRMGDARREMLQPVLDAGMPEIRQLGDGLSTQ